MASKYATAKIIAALQAADGLVSVAARALACSPQTIYNRAHQVQTVQAAITEARAELVDLGEKALREALIRGEPWAVSLTLKTLGKSRGYTERQEVAGLEDVTIVVKYPPAEGAPDLRRLNDAELGTLENLMAKATPEAD